jgi:hypothetical protein
VAADGAGARDYASGRAAPGDLLGLAEAIERLTQTYWALMRALEA